MFRKFKNDGSGGLIPDNVQANVTVSAIASDIYVEIALYPKGMVVIYAHEHTFGKLRLPQ